MAQSLEEGGENSLVRCLGHMEPWTRASASTAGWWVPVGEGQDRCLRSAGAEELLPPAQPAAGTMSQAGKSHLAFV